MMDINVWLSLVGMPLHSLFRRTEVGIGSFNMILRFFFHGLVRFDCALTRS